VKWYYSIHVVEERSHVGNVMTYVMSWPQANIEITGVTSHVGKEGLQQTWPAIRSDHGGVFPPHIAVLPGDIPEGAHISFQLLDSNKKPIGSVSEVVTAKNSGWGVISDIDDTIKHTGVLSKDETFRTTFAKDFYAVPGMADFYQHLSKVLNTLPPQETSSGFHTPTSNVLFAYLSASPIFIADLLVNFMKKSGFPTGALITANTLIFNIVKMSKLRDLLTYKTGKAQQLLKDFSQKNWIFVGDSGQMDPTVYATLYKQLSRDPNKKICIYIRAVSGVNADREKIRNRPRRFIKAFDGVPHDKWVVFRDPKELEGVDPNKSCYPADQTNPHPKEDTGSEDTTTEDAKGMNESTWNAIMRDIHM